MSASEQLNKAIDEGRASRRREVERLQARTRARIHRMKCERYIPGYKPSRKFSERISNPFKAVLAGMR